MGKTKKPSAGGASPLWESAIRSSADPDRVRELVQRARESELSKVLDACSPAQANVVCGLFAGSPYLAEQWRRHPDWAELVADLDSLKFPRRKVGMARQLEAELEAPMSQADYAGALGRVRRFRQREMFRIGLRDLAALTELVGTVEEISNVADVCVEMVYRIGWASLTAKLGFPFHRLPDGQWAPTEFCVLGMGKFGGRELNYSSDIDVLFVYTDEGHMSRRKPRKGQKTPSHALSNHGFFGRLAEWIVREIGQTTVDGALYRIDLRLRPEGNTGPLARSLEAYENYYAQWGQTWERMMLLKARCVAGATSVEAEFFEMIHSFRYPRDLGERALKDVAEIKRRIEAEVVKSGEIDRNVKLGRGGIREVEFIVQTLQLTHAGRFPFLQNSRTLPALTQLVRYGLLPEEDAEGLSEAYVFLRNLEHRLQMEANQQTHSLPEPGNDRARERLAYLMGFATSRTFEAALKEHTRLVRRVYERLLPENSGGGTPDLPGNLAEDAAGWRSRLAAHGFRDPAQALSLITTLLQGPGFTHIAARTKELARDLVRLFLELCPSPDGAAKGGGAGLGRLSDPDRVLTRLDSFIENYGARALLYESWASNPTMFHVLLTLFDRSEYLAELVLRSPDLVETVHLSGHLRRSKNVAETLTDLRHGAADVNQHRWIRKYYQAEQTRLGLRYILGLSDDESTLREVTALAEATLRYALEVVLIRRGIELEPMAIIGLGKLGGRELNFGSDLDILFVAADGTRGLRKLQTVAVEVMRLLSDRSEDGTTFETDARLRPDGDKGWLVNTVKKHREYYSERARLWEIQCLTRLRFVGGDEAVGTQFTEMAHGLIDFRKPRPDLAAYSNDWRGEIFRMRQRIEAEKTPPGHDELAIKTGSGGMIDVEFLAQTLCLEHGWVEANTLRVLESAGLEGVLKPQDVKTVTDGYRELRRVEGILRLWSFEGETVLPDQPAPLRRVASRCGFATGEALLASLAKWRKRIRSVVAREWRRAR